MNSLLFKLPRACGIVAALALISGHAYCQTTTPVNGWAFVSNGAGGFTMTQPAAGSVTLTAETPSATSGSATMAIRAMIEPVLLTAGDSLTFSGSFTLSSTVDGPAVRLGPANTIFGLLNSRDLGGTISGGFWTGSEGRYRGYSILVPSGASIPENPWSLGEGGAVGAISSSKAISNWYVTDRSYGLGGPFQQPAGAVAGPGTYQFSLKVFRAGLASVRVDYLVTSGDGYRLEGSAWDNGVSVNNVLASAYFDSVGFRFGSGHFTSVVFQDVATTLERGPNPDPASLFEFEESAEGWYAYSEGSTAQAAVQHAALMPGSEELGYGALEVAPISGGFKWAARVDLAQGNTVYERLADALENNFGLTQQALAFDVVLQSERSAGYNGWLQVFSVLQSGGHWNQYGQSGDDAPVATDWDGDKTVTAILPLRHATFDPEAATLNLIIGINSAATNGDLSVLIDNVRLVAVEPTPTERLLQAEVFFGTDIVIDGWVPDDVLGWVYAAHFPWVYSIDLNEWRGGGGSFFMGWLWCAGDEVTWMWDAYLNKWIYSSAEFWPWIYTYDSHPRWDDLRTPLAGFDLHALSPGVFTFANGQPVETAEDWPARREELKELFEDVIYGHKPPPPDSLSINAAEWTVNQQQGTRTQNLSVTMTVGDNSFTVSMSVTVPLDPEGPVPVMMAMGGGTTYLQRGWAVATVNFLSLAPDANNARETGGLYQLFGSDIDTGVLMAWAWAHSRLIDVLEIQDYPEIDLGKIAMTGHSRYGKATAVTGVFDERLALTAPSHSGTGGVGPFQLTFPGGEQIHTSLTYLPVWYSPELHNYRYNLPGLPVDNHLISALIAPRGLIQTEGTNDPGTNPPASQMTFMLAQEVYTLLGVPERAGIHIRPVGHVPNDGDVADFGEFLWYGRALPDGFNRLPYSVAPIPPEE